jgi:hypothetical protein
MKRLSLSCDDAATWHLEGEAVGAMRSFGSLTEALACGRELTHAAETLIELRVSGFYACVHQEQGWPRRIQAPKAAA